MVDKEREKCDCGSSLCCCGRFVGRAAISDLSQSQNVSQLNLNLQIAAIAIATNGVTAKVSQQNCQTNRDLRKASCIATTCETLTCNDICEDSDEEFSASDVQNRQDSQSNINIDGIDAVIVGAETEIERNCTQEMNNIVEVRTTIATSCSQVTGAQPVHLKEEYINAQHSAPENQKPILEETPLFPLSVNGKEIRNHPQSKNQTIKRVASNGRNSKDKNPLVLNFGNFHVTLNLDGLSLDVEAKRDGRVLVDGKGVRL